MGSSNIQNSTNQKICVGEVDVSYGGSIPSSPLSRNFKSKEKHLVSREDCSLTAVAKVCPDVEGWKVDEHWTAMTAYLAEMYLPYEG